MSDTETTTEVENAKTSETSELADAAAMVEEIAAADRARESGTSADTTTEEPFEATEAQITMAKQLGVSDDEIADMTQAQADAYDKVARLDSRRQQRKGKPKEEVESSESVESSADDEFTEDDWYTNKGTKIINQVLKGQKAQAKRDADRDQQTKTSQSDRLKVEVDKVFDGLDKEIFTKYLPGETDQIEPNSPAELEREKAVTMAKAIQSASAEDISMEEALGEALSIVAPAETENAAQNEANDRRKKRGSQRLGAPASSRQTRKKPDQSPEDEAIDTILEAVNG